MSRPELAPRHAGVAEDRALAARADLESLAGAHLTRGRMIFWLALLTAALAISLIVGSAFGSVHINFVRAFRDSASPDRAILMGARLPRVLMGAVVGAVLAAVGTALQALVRNPLAEGGILGISGGGALGAIVALVMLSQSAASDVIVPLIAFAAALASTVMVYRLALVEGRLEPFTLLLIGVIFNSFWGAAIMLVNSVVNFYFAHSILFWLMGSLEAPSYREVVVVAILGGAGFAILMLCARDMNLLSFGDEPAAELGVEVDRVRRTIFFATSIMIGAAVSVSGIITFVGLIVPHMLRLALGADHRLLLPASLIGGAAFMVVADLAARVAIAPSEIAGWRNHGAVRRTVLHLYASPRRQKAVLAVSPAGDRGRLALHASEIVAGYGGAQVLRGVSLELAAGEMLAVVGPNGAGKSTLLKVLGGTLARTSGAIELFSRPLDSFDRRALARIVAMVAQENSVAFQFTVLEVVLMGRAPHLASFHLETRRDLEIAHSALSHFDLLALAGRHIRELSGGERKRVFLARALAQDPKIALLDEPAAFLDLRHVADIFSRFGALRAERGLAVVATLHDLNAAALYADRVLLMKDGAAVACGTPEAVLTEENLRHVYDTPVYVGRNPSTGALAILPGARESLARA